MCVALQCSAQLKELSQQKPAEGCMPQCKGCSHTSASWREQLLLRPQGSDMPCLAVTLPAAGPGNLLLHTALQETAAKHGAEDSVLLRGRCLRALSAAGPAADAAAAASILACMHATKCAMRRCGLAYNVRWTVGSEAMFKGDKECWCGLANNVWWTVGSEAMFKGDKECW